MAVFDDVVKEGKLKIFDKGIEFGRDGEPVTRQTAETTLFFPEKEPLREELAHFADCVRTRRPPRTDGQNGLRVLKVLDACQRSLTAGGQPVFLDAAAATATTPQRHRDTEKRTRKVAVAKRARS